MYLSGMRIHLIAIGGSAMHNIALALHTNGHHVSGSDDEIYDPARSRLAGAGLLPAEEGWFPESITADMDAIILGMHARADNPEIFRAQQLGIKIYSYPEFVYEHAKDKTRIVIAGSHGKTTTTSMVMHVLKHHGVAFDYLVGAQIPGFDLMVQFSDAPIMVIEGDEYLSSCLDRRPKFLHYHPNIAVLTGISWDHINVFPEFEDYVAQFKLFLDSLADGAQLYYYQQDETIQSLVKQLPEHVSGSPYGVIDGADERHFGSIQSEGKTIELQVFGRHNLENMQAAAMVCAAVGISRELFLEAIQTFQGASKRLQIFLSEPQGAVVFDFAHAPSKLKASLQAVKLQYAPLKIRGIFELHTFSSLNQQFLKEYAFSMREADEAIVCLDQHTLDMKQMPRLSEQSIRESFKQDQLIVFTDKISLENYLREMTWDGYCTIFMSSGTFMGIPVKQIAQDRISPVGHL
jgi:UDP-N-acetylmuramate: L-alanyl-gamma-D-glutamyl-meso-diaminopimelate ligase